MSPITCFLADGREDPVRLDPSQDVTARNLWVVVHAELARQARVRAVVSFVTRQFEASRERSRERCVARGDRHQ